MEGKLKAYSQLPRSSPEYFLGFWSGISRGIQLLHYLDDWLVMVESVSCPVEHHLLNIQPIVVVRGLKRQEAAALTNFVECFFFFLLYLVSFFLLLVSVLNDLTGPSTGPLARITYSIPFQWNIGNQTSSQLAKLSFL